MGGDPHQPDLGTRMHRYGCSLPGLTGFTALRCEGPMRVTIEPVSASWARMEIRV